VYVCVRGGGVLTVRYGDLIERIAKLVWSSNNVPLLLTMRSIFQTASTDPEFGQGGITNGSRTKVQLLNEEGFQIFGTAGFDRISKELKTQASQLASEVAASVLAVWKGSGSSNS
jgi:hypothetical protein